MNKDKPKFTFLYWLKHIGPFITIIGALGLVFLSRSKLVTFSIGEVIIISFLVILAVDSFIERISYLDKIETKLFSIQKNTLIIKDMLPPADIQGKDAEDILIISPALETLFQKKDGFFEETIKKNKCNIRILILDMHNEKAAYTWRRLAKNKRIDYQRKMDELIDTINGYKIDGDDREIIRKSDVFIPFSMFATNTTNGKGEMAIEIHNYEVSGAVRPHIYLTIKDDPVWFDHFKNQFESAWNQNSRIN